MAVQTQIQARRGTAATWTSTNPTLAAGETGFETDTGKFKIGNGSTAWAALAYSAGATAVTYLFNATAGQTTFSGADANSLTLAYTVGAEQVYLNGVLQVRGSDYTATNGTSIVLTSGALVSDVLNVIAYSAMSITDTYTQAQANALFIPDAIVDAKGDLIAATANDTLARLAVGANDTVLTADSTAATGLKWAAPASAIPGFTLLNAGGTTLTGAATVRVTGLTSNTLMILIDGASSVSASAGIGVRFNNDSTNNVYRWYGSYSTYTAGGADSSPNSNGYILGRMGSASAANTVVAGLMVYGAKSTAAKPVMGHGGGNGTGAWAFWKWGAYENTSAITSVDIFSDTGNLDAGTVYIYGSAV